MLWQRNTTKTLLRKFIKAWFSLDASVSISTSRNTKGKRHVMTFKDKAKWFSFELSFVLAHSYACSYAYAYVDAYVAHFAGLFCLTFCLDPCAYACVVAYSENQA